MGFQELLAIFGESDKKQRGCCELCHNWYVLILTKHIDFGNWNKKIKHF